MYGNLSITTATSEINETVESMSRFLTTNRNIELLEPYEGKLSRTVLRGERGSNALDLPDIQKQGDFFVESPIILLAAIIWYLRIYKDVKQKGPSWIDCRIGKDEKVLPMIPGGGDINDIIME